MKTRSAGSIYIAAAVIAASSAWPALADKKSDTLNIAWDQPLENADAYFNTSRTGILAARMIWDMLIERDPDTFEYMPALATSWKWLDDLTLDLELRRGVKFHDGQPFDADDVVYTLNWVIDPANKILNPTLVSWIKNAVRLEPYKVRIQLSAPFPPALEYLAGAIPIYPRRYYSAAGPQGMGRKPIGTGPYKVESLDPGKEVVFVRNAEYWEGSAKGKPRISRVRARQIPEKPTQIAELLSGGIDLMWYVPKDQVESLKGVKGLQVSAGETMRVGYLYLDAAGRSGDSPLKDVRVRRAIAHALDRAQFTKAFFGDAARVLDAPCFPTQFGCYQGGTRYEYDVAKARRLMAEAGYRDGFDTELYGYRLPRQWEEAIAGYLRAIGIRANINILQYPAFRDKNRAGVTPISFGDWGSYSINDASAILGNFFSGTPDDFTGDKELQALVKEAGSVANKDKRLAAYRAAITRIMDQVYIVPLNSYSIYYAYSTELDFRPFKDEIPRYYLYCWK